MECFSSDDSGQIFEDALNELTTRLRNSKSDLFALICGSDLICLYMTNCGHNTEHFSFIPRRAKSKQIFFFFWPITWEMWEGFLMSGIVEFGGEFVKVPQKPYVC